MNRTVPDAATDSPTLAAAIATASRIIAPTWPLDEQIAINPWWGMIDRPFAEVAALLHRLNGAPLAWPAQAYLAAWESGEITSSAVERALHERCAGAGVTDALAALRTAPGCGPGLDLPSDLIDRQPDAAGPRWRETITQQVSQFCASYFDADQADWHRRHPAGLFAGWRAALLRDHAIEPLMHAPRFRAFAAQIPQDAEAAIDWALKRLAVPVSEAVPLLMLSLLRINGWASWCAYRAWAAARAGREDRTLEELLAIRISWEALLIDCDESRTDTAEIWRDHWPKALQAAA
ncbi:MAG: DUF2309 family protein, partial [Gammaproteobacteria bacterium]|nr:DUF2309 family protein [Gammaproteobacteria bacterium]